MLQNFRSSYISENHRKRFSTGLCLFSSIFWLLACAMASETIAEVEASPPRSGVLIPLYIYPVRGAWDPLYQAIETHPSLTFTVVINPNSGPGKGLLPDANYTREVTKLNTYPNVRPIGYVAVDYGRRALDATAADIAHYGQWAQTNPNLKVQGIFLDEAPRNADNHNASYVATVKDIISNNPYIGSRVSGQVPFVVTNPGSIPEKRLLNAADKTVVFEEMYQTYINLQAARSLAALPNRDQLCCLMHSIPYDITPQQLKALTRELRRLAGNVFLTDLSIDYYQQFSPRFSEYIDALV